MVLFQGIAAAIPAAYIAGLTVFLNYAFHSFIENYKSFNLNFQWIKEYIFRRMSILASSSKILILGRLALSHSVYRVCTDS